MKGTTALVRPSLVKAAKPLSRVPSSKTPERRSLLSLIQATLDDAKAEDVITLELAGQSSLADQMVMATGRVDRHVSALADHVVSAMKDHGFPTPRVEGTEANEWVLIDAGDVIVHIFKPDARSFYNIERLWGADRPKDQRAEQ